LQAVSAYAALTEVAFGAVNVGAGVKAFTGFGATKLPARTFGITAGIRYTEVPFIGNCLTELAEGAGEFAFLAGRDADAFHAQISCRRALGELVDFAVAVVVESIANLGLRADVALANFAAHRAYRESKFTFAGIADGFKARVGAKVAQARDWRFVDEGVAVIVHTVANFGDTAGSALALEGAEIAD